MLRPVDNGVNPLHLVVSRIHECQGDKCIKCSILTLFVAHAGLLAPAANQDQRKSEDFSVMNHITPQVGRLCDIPSPHFLEETVRGRIVGFDDWTVCVAVLSEGAAGDSIWDLRWIDSRDVTCIAGERCSEPRDEVAANQP